jgi:hypothetical protein
MGRNPTSLNTISWPVTLSLRCILLLHATFVFFFIFFFCFFSSPRSVPPSLPSPERSTYRGQGSSFHPQSQPPALLLLTFVRISCCQVPASPFPYYYRLLFHVKALFIFSTSIAFSPINCFYKNTFLNKRLAFTVLPLICTNVYKIRVLQN